MAVDAVTAADLTTIIVACGNTTFNTIVWANGYITDEESPIKKTVDHLIGLLWSHNTRILSRPFTTLKTSLRVSSESMRDNQVAWLRSRDVITRCITTENDTLTKAIDVFVAKMQIITRNTLSLDEKNRITRTTARELEEMEVCIRNSQASVETNLNTIDDHLNRVSDAYVRFLQHNPVAPDTRPPSPA